MPTEGPPSEHFLYLESFEEAGQPLEHGVRLFIKLNTAVDGIAYMQFYCNYSEHSKTDVTVFWGEDKRENRRDIDFDKITKLYVTV